VVRCLPQRAQGTQRGRGAWCCPGAWGRRAALREGRETTEGMGGEEEDGVGGRSPPVFLSVLSASSVVFLRRFRVIRCPPQRAQGTQRGRGLGVPWARGGMESGTPGREGNHGGNEG